MMTAFQAGVGFTRPMALLVRYKVAGFCTYSEPYPGRYGARRSPTRQGLLGCDLALPLPLIPFPTAHFLTKNLRDTLSSLRRRRVRRIAPSANFVPSLRSLRLKAEKCRSQHSPSPLCRAASPSAGFIRGQRCPIGHSEIIFSRSRGRSTSFPSFAARPACPRACCASEDGRV